MGGADEAAHAGFTPELRIDWLPAARFGDGLRGDVGLTILPGKRGASERYPGRSFTRDLASDLAALTAAGIRRLILLVDDGELARWSDAAIVERAATSGIDVRRHPIPDGDAPASLAEMDAILADLVGGRRDGPVAVACMGGVGRTGTVAACALVAAGVPPGEAIAEVRAIRHPTAVETRAQEDFVRAFAQARR